MKTLKKLLTISGIVVGGMHCVMLLLLAGCAPAQLAAPQQKERTEVQQEPYLGTINGLPAPGRSIIFFGAKKTGKRGTVFDFAFIFFCRSEEIARAALPVKAENLRSNGWQITETQLKTFREQAQIGLEGSVEGTLKVIKREPVYWPYIAFTDDDGSEGRLMAFRGDADKSKAVCDLLAPQLREKIKNLEVILHLPRPQ